jgi:hypothetical protein
VIKELARKTFHKLSALTLPSPEGEGLMEEVISRKFLDFCANSKVFLPIPNGRRGSARVEHVAEHLLRASRPFSD